MATAIGLVASGAMAQNVPTQVMLTDEYGLQVPSNVGGTIVLDNFQYWNSPRDMGWEPIEPAYPIWGAGIGYGMVETVVDFQEGSRVMEVYCPPSVFMQMNAPTMMPYTISKLAKYRPAPNGEELLGIPGAFSNMTFKIKAPVSVELFDTFRVIVRVRTITDANTAAAVNLANGKTADMDTVTAGVQDADIPIGATQVGCPNCFPANPLAFGIVDIEFTPRDFPVGCTPDNVAGRILTPVPATTAITPESAIYTKGGQATGAQPSRIQVAMGRTFQDGSWHFEQEPLATIVGAVYGQQIFEILGVTVRGNGYRLDDVMFTVPGADISNNNAPYLFRIGPVYGQLFLTGQSRFIFAEDADNVWFMTDAAMLAKAQLDPAFGQKLNAMAASIPALKARLQAATATPDFPFIEDNAGNTPGNKRADGTAGTGFTLSEARFRIGGTSVAGLTQPTIFQFTVGDTLGPISQNLAQPVDLATALGSGNTDLLPPYIPLLGVPAQRWVMNTPAAGANNPMVIMAMAMANTYGEFMGVRVLKPATGQVFEDMIVTCRVTDSMAYDMETFPISVVNYPVTNLPPMIEQLEDQFFQVGSTGVYQITATDPDMIDMVGGLTYKATLNGLPNYQYGPWMNQIISPTTGTVSFAPQFEGALTCVVTVTDPRGMQAIGHFTIFCVNSGTWLNHPPIVTSIIESPQITKAGQLFTISDLNIVDPDNQQLYYSCNVGAVGRGGVFTFQSEFPGEYLVQITAYDILGGAVTQQFVLQVMPWWSF